MTLVIIKKKIKKILIYYISKSIKKFLIYKLDKSFLFMPIIECIWSEIYENNLKLLFFHFLLHILFDIIYHILYIICLIHIHINDFVIYILYFINYIHKYGLILPYIKVLEYHIHNYVNVLKNILFFFCIHIHDSHQINIYS